MNRRTAQQVAERVEWLAALWELTERPEEARCANPHLLAVLRFAPSLLSHPASGELARSRERGRDRLIKDIAAGCYGQPDAAALLSARLAEVVADAKELIGPGPLRVIQDARQEAQGQVEALAGELDPATELAEVTGEQVSVRIVLAPSVFLPPPQAGRHGSLIRRRRGHVAHLHFGFPLRQDPAAVGISRPWLLGGAWHYAIEVYLQRHWPRIAHRLAQRPGLAEAVADALELTPGDRDRWTDLLRAHVNIAFKCLLSRRVGVPDAVHRAFAQARGLVLFPWFEEWLGSGEAGGSPLSAHLATLPEALAVEHAAWQGLAPSGGGGPLAINLALLSASARRASLVVPDAWGDEAAQAVAGWRLLPLPLLHFADWKRTRNGDRAPVIAFGSPRDNPLVRRVLEQRGLSLEGPTASADQAIVALSAPGFEDADWCVAVAVSHAAAAAHLRIETALKQTSSYFVVDRGEVTDACPARLGPVPTRRTPTPRPGFRGGDRCPSKAATGPSGGPSQPERRVDV